MSLMQIMTLRYEYRKLLEVAYVTILCRSGKQNDEQALAMIELLLSKGNAYLVLNCKGAKATGDKVEDKIFEANFGHLKVLGKKPEKVIN